MKVKTASSILFDIIFYIFLGCIGIFLLTSYKAKVEGTTPSIFGYGFYSVLTGSMEPTINTGSLVVVKNAQVQEIKNNDIITFRSGDKGVLVTHRVKDTIKDGSISFVTQGDANNVVDGSLVTSKNLVGKVVLTVPFVGKVSVFIKENIITMLILLLTAIAVVKYVKYILKK